MSTTQSPEVSIIIPTCNRVQSLERTILSLRNQVNTPSFEVLVVNDESTDDTADRLAEWCRQWPNWIRALNSNHRGPGTARNVGIREAKGRIIALIDDDCIPESDWLSKIVTGYDQDDRLAGIGGQTFPVDNRSIFSRYQDIFSLHQPHQDITGVTFLLTNNASFRKDRLLEIGGFDETFFMAAEDVDLSRRLRACGYTLGYQPEARVMHHNITTFYGYLKVCYRHGQGQVLLHRNYPAWYKILRTVWWARHLFSWLWIPINAWRLKRERASGWKDSLVFAVLASGQDMIGYIGSLSLIRYIVKGRKT